MPFLGARIGDSTNNPWYRYSLPTSSGDIALTSDIPSAGTDTPEPSGTASAGSANTWSRSDHVHPDETEVTPGGYEFPESAFPIVAHFDNSYATDDVITIQSDGSYVWEVGNGDTQTGALDILPGGDFEFENYENDMVEWSISIPGAFGFEVALFDSSTLVYDSLINDPTHTRSAV